ncbi:MAG: hypothetical protein CMK46_06895 [Porticoccus sp.]|nr:hypothetical protein [Rhodospirillaceae bacterium]MBG58000.1 hypothetical protein [Porticoccus sp.]MAX61607.1 hypothetical protein [Rhodospirillaceae bacterium]MAX61672.1 hypothetical protein [Rhodospirillaceae bacterium]MAX61737.1 hypothetical protein [Rhodospirillaceae bacterium]
MSALAAVHRAETTQAQPALAAVAAGSPCDSCFVHLMFRRPFLLLSAPVARQLRMGWQQMEMLAAIQHLALY